MPTILTLLLIGGAAYGAYKIFIEPSLLVEERRKVLESLYSSARASGREFSGDPNLQARGVKMNIGSEQSPWKVVDFALTDEELATLEGHLNWGLFGPDWTNMFRYPHMFKAFQKKIGDKYGIWFEKVLQAS